LKENTLVFEISKSKRLVNPKTQKDNDLVEIIKKDTDRFENGEKL